MTNRSQQLTTLKYRLATLQSLTDDFSKHKYLLPEILIKTLKDLHRFQNNGESNLNGIEIMEYFQISYSDLEKTMLNDIEKSLRKATEYQKFCTNYSKETLMSVTQKLQKYLLSVQY